MEHGKQPVEATLVVTLQERWSSVQQASDAIANELDQRSSDFPRSTGNRLRNLRDWFRGPVEYQDALKRPDVLSVCLPLLDAHRNTISGSMDKVNPISASAISRATRSGICAFIGLPTSSHWNLAIKMLYPATILLAAWIVWVAFSFWLAPQFEDLMNSFEIQLPGATAVVYGLARFVRRWWWIMITLPLASLLIVSVFVRWGERQQTNNASWLNQTLLGTRHAMGSWAWHLSMLLTAGVPEKNAVAIAGATSAKPLVRQLSSAWAVRETPPQDAATTYYEREPIEPFVLKSKFDLLNPIMELANSQAKSSLLRVAAIYYWERSQTASEWWIQWLVVAIVWFVGAMVAFVVLSLFMPLISVIGGLTGGIW